MKRRIRVTRLLAAGVAAAAAAWPLVQVAHAGPVPPTVPSDVQVPEGNKVLIDLAERKVEKHVPKRLRPTAKFIGKLTIQEPISVRELAALLGQHPSRIIVDLLGIGIYSSVDTRLEFGAVRKIAREYGYEVKRLA